MRSSAFPLTLLVVLASASPAAAESASLLIDERLEGTAYAEVRAAAIEVLAEHGVRLVRAADGEPCADAECAATMAETLGVDFIVLITLEAEPEAGLGVRVVGPAGVLASAVGDLDAGPAGAAAEALDRSLAVRRGVAMGFLLVRSRPPGARVEIDGEAAGTTPIRRMVRPGEHEVRLIPTSGEPRERTVTVEARAEARWEEDFARASEGGGDEGSVERSGPARTEPSFLNFVIGGALALGGIVLLISPLDTLAKEGQCVSLIEGVGCRERVQFGVQSGFLFGLGIAALAAAVIIDVTAPIQVRVGGADGAYLGIQGAF